MTAASFCVSFRRTKRKKTATTNNSATVVKPSQQNGVLSNDSCAHDPHHHHHNHHQQHNHHHNKMMNGYINSSFPNNNKNSATSSATSTNGVHCLAGCNNDDVIEEEDNEMPPLYIVVMVFIHYGILALFAYLREFLRAVGLEKNMKAPRECPKMLDFVPLYSDFEWLYTRNFYVRIRDCWNRPIASVPGRKMSIMEWRTPDYGWTFEMTGRTLDVINLGSYNYLGFAQNSGPCAEDAVQAIKTYGIGTCSSRFELGNLAIHKQLDDSVAQFLGVEAAMCFPMGFATNSMNIGCCVGKNCLILSDELNHASIVLGCRLSQATIKIFKHNDVDDLERHLRNALVYGQARTRRPYKKILVCIEGIYSMEGTIVNLPGILAVCKKYRAYVYLDEAHSIGAIGKHGRGVCDYYGIDPREIDILMGTFTKSFGSVGGYLAGKKSLIDHLKATSHTVYYGSTSSAPCVQQILTSTAIIMGKDQRDDGPARIRTLARNSRYFRAKLCDMGFTVYGNPDSPVVPVLMYFLSKITYASRVMLRRGIGLVVVGFPATPMAMARARLCLSASHTKEDLDEVLKVLDEVGQVISIQHSTRTQNAANIEY